ncbi:MAG TPA: MBL fold metallo-hydrolase, partial [Candidatus Krumholzibacterium sp.]|nr:MBL fold metallo-hydrolase [Candidatus Krumholzibacterium sp.]
GQRPDDLDWKGNTPVHSAVNGRRLESVKYLIEAGADLTIKDENGQTPFDLAIEREAGNVLAFLRSKGYKETPVVDPDIVQLAENLRRITFPFHMKTNILVQTGADGTLLVDTGFSKRAAGRLKEEIAAMRGGKIGYIINSHEHWDHVAGNFIAGEATRTISYGRIDEALSGGALSRVDEQIPGKTGRGFDHYYTMRVNGEEIRLIPYPGVHSESDMLICFTGSGVVHVGDLLLAQSFPAIGNVPGYLEFLDTLIDVFPLETTFVCGHGKDLDYEGLLEYRKMLRTTVEIVRAEMEKGLTLDEIRESDALKDFESYGEFLTFLNTGSWTNAIFGSYR